MNMHSENYEENLENFVFKISKSTITQKKNALEDARKYRVENNGARLSVYDLFNHLSNLGYSDSICEDVCFKENVE